MEYKQHEFGRLAAELWKKGPRQTESHSVELWLRAWHVVKLEEGWIGSETRTGRELQ